VNRPNGKLFKINLSNFKKTQIGKNKLKGTTGLALSPDGSGLFIGSSAKGNQFRTINPSVGRRGDPVVDTFPMKLNGNLFKLKA
jgi:sugar lactone lactonase YvrE|tara:strand:- start:314 stop:565 length:252 start_codon:yes stop_codon:yes gene_type:complete